MHMKQTGGGKRSGTRALAFSSWARPALSLQ